MAAAYVLAVELAGVAPEDGVPKALGEVLVELGRGFDHGRAYRQHQRLGGGVVLDPDARGLGVDADHLQHFEYLAGDLVEADPFFGAGHYHRVAVSERGLEVLVLVERAGDVGLVADDDRGLVQPLVAVGGPVVPALKYPLGHESDKVEPISTTLTLRLRHDPVSLFERQHRFKAHTLLQRSLTSPIWRRQITPVTWNFSARASDLN